MNPLASFQDGRVALCTRPARVERMVVFVQEESAVRFAHAVLLAAVDAATNFLALTKADPVLVVHRHVDKP